VVKFVGGKSGFKSARDLMLFFLGAGILVFHLATVPAKQYNVTILLFSAGLMGAPYVLGKDEGGNGT
jgi:hypothetical protein